MFKKFKKKKKKKKNYSLLAVNKLKKTFSRLFILLKQSIKLK
jgi:hypothetical protein